MFREYFRTRRILREARRIQQNKLRALQKANAHLEHVNRVNHARSVIMWDSLDRNMARFNRECATR